MHDNMMKTVNLLLRRMTQMDAADLFIMRKDPRMHQYTDTKPDETLEDTKAYIDKMNKGIEAGKWIIWAIEHKASHRVIGTISIWNLDYERKSGELGYGIMPAYQGQGLMKEALQRAIRYGFEEMSLEILEAYTEENNLQSNKLLERCNFKVADRVMDEGYTNNRIYNMIVYRICK